jgi:hypothetical protein
VVERPARDQVVDGPLCDPGTEECRRDQVVERRDRDQVVDGPVRDRGSGRRERDQVVEARPERHANSVDGAEMSSG